MIKKYETQKQLGNLEEKHQILIGHVNKWLEVQLAYIPEIGSCVAATISQFLAAEEVPLFLPSSLVLNLQNTPGISKYWLARFSYVLHRQMMHWLISDTTCASSLASGSLKRSILVELVLNNEGLQVEWSKSLERKM